MPATSKVKPQKIFEQTKCLPDVLLSNIFFSYGFRKIFCLNMKNLQIIQLMRVNNLRAEKRFIRIRMTDLVHLSLHPTTFTSANGLFNGQYVTGCSQR